MIKSVNLYILSRIDNEASCLHVEMHAACKDETKRTQVHEITSLC